MYKKTTLVDAERALIAPLEPMMRAADAASATIVGLITTNNTEGLRAFAADKMYPVFDPMQGVIGQLIQVQLGVANNVYQQSVVDTRVMIISVASSLGLAVALGLFLAYRMLRGLLGLLGAEPHKMHAAAQAVTVGDLSAPASRRAGAQRRGVQARCVCGRPRTNSRTCCTCCNPTNQTGPLAKPCCGPSVACTDRNAFLSGLCWPDFFPSNPLETRPWA